jgi:multidrug efflux system outer membrane protein
MLKNVMRMSSVASLLAALAACAVGPTYHRPETPASEPRNIAGAHFSALEPNAAWWEQFEDPVLADLGARALADNLDLHIAIARVHSARAAFSEAQFNYAPHVQLDGSYSRAKEQLPGFTTDRLNIDSTSVGFDATWEIDLFGHVRHEAAAARATLGAEQANLADAQVTIAAEVARSYFELRGAQRQIMVAHDNLDNEREALRLTQVRYEAGRVTELDEDSAQARLKATEATLPVLEAAEKRSAYRLAVLLGMRPGALDAQLKAVPVQE